MERGVQNEDKRGGCVNIIQELAGEERDNGELGWRGGEGKKQKKRTGISK